MKNVLVSVSVIAIVAMLTSCSVTVPMSVSAAPIGNKIGISKTTVFWGAQMNKNFGIAEAAKNGGIKGGVGIADLKSKNCFFFKKLEIIAYGN